VSWSTRRWSVTGFGAAGEKFVCDTNVLAAPRGLEVVDMRMERLRQEYLDIGAVVYFLRKVIWTVPDFTVARYRDRLAKLHERIESDGPFVTHSARILVEARKPDRRAD
jgi:hypothetical protein